MYSDDLLKAAIEAGVVVMERKESEPEPQVPLLPSYTQFQRGHFKRNRTACCDRQARGLPVRQKLFTTWLIGMEDENYDQPRIGFVWNQNDPGWETLRDASETTDTFVRAAQQFRWEDREVAHRRRQPALPSAQHIYVMGDFLDEAREWPMRLMTKGESINLTQAVFGPKHINNTFDLSDLFDWDDLYWDNEEPKEYAFVTYPPPAIGAYWNPSIPIYAANSVYGPNWINQRPGLWAEAICVSSQDVYRDIKYWMRRLGLNSTFQENPWQRLEI